MTEVAEMVVQESTVDILDAAPQGTHETQPVAEAKPKSGVRDAVQKANQAWKDRFDGAYTLKYVELGAHPVRQMSKRTYDQIGRCCHFVSFFGRILLGPQHVVEAETALNNMIGAAQKEFDEHIARMRILLENEGIEEMAAFSKQETLPMMVVMPAQNKYLKVLTTADLYLLLVNTLWLEGLIGDKEKGKAELRFKHHARTISSFARRMRVGLLRKLKDKHDRGEGNVAGEAELADGAADTAPVLDGDADDGAPAKPARAKKAAKAVEAGEPEMAESAISAAA